LHKQTIRKQASFAKIKLSRAQAASTFFDGSTVTATGVAGAVSASFGTFLS